MFHGIHEDRGQPTLQTFIGQIGVGRNLLGPDGMGESHGSLHQSILKKFASSRNHTRLTNEKDTEKMWVKISLEKGGQGGLKGIASTLGRCDNSAEDSRPGTAHQAVVTRGYPPAPPSQGGDNTQRNPDEDKACTRPTFQHTRVGVRGPKPRPRAVSLPQAQVVLSGSLDLYLFAAATGRPRRQRRGLTRGRHASAADPGPRKIKTSDQPSRATTGPRVSGTETQLLVG